MISQLCKYAIFTVLLIVTKKNYAFPPTYNVKNKNDSPYLLNLSLYNLYEALKEGINLYPLSSYVFLEKHIPSKFFTNPSCMSMVCQAYEQLVKASQNVNLKTFNEVQFVDFIKSNINQFLIIFNLKNNSGYKIIFDIILWKKILASTGPRWEGEYIHEPTKTIFPLYLSFNPISSDEQELTYNGICIIVDPSQENLPNFLIQITLYPKPEICFCFNEVEKFKLDFKSIIKKLIKKDSANLITEFFIEQNKDIILRICPRFHVPLTLFKKNTVLSFNQYISSINEPNSLIFDYCCTPITLDTDNSSLISITLNLGKYCDENKFHNLTEQKQGYAYLTQSQTDHIYLVITINDQENKYYLGTQSSIALLLDPNDSLINILFIHPVDHFLAHLLPLPEPNAFLYVNI